MTSLHHKGLVLSSVEFDDNALGSWNFIDAHYAVEFPYNGGCVSKLGGFAHNLVDLLVVWCVAHFILLNDFCLLLCLLFWKYTNKILRFLLNEMFG